MEAILIFGIISGVIFFVVAELFGRAKHIGRWWSFFLLWGCFIVPGVIAILFSPSAKGEPTKPNSFIKYLGIALFFVFGVLGVISLSISGSSDVIAYSIPVAFMILGAYLVWLGEGKVRNDSPKYYFSKPMDKASKVVGHAVERLRQIPVPSTKGVNTTFYFTVEDGAKQGPFTFEEICAKRLLEDQMVWRHGLEQWVKAKELQELRAHIVYAPPPVLTESPLGDAQSEYDDSESENLVADIDVDNLNGQTLQVSDMSNVSNDVTFREKHEKLDLLKGYRTFYLTMLILCSIFLNGSLIGLFVSYYNGLDCTILLSLLAIFINYQAYSIWYVWYRSKVNSWLTLWPLIKPSVAILSISVLIFVIIFQLYYSLQFLFYVIQVG